MKKEIEKDNIRSQGKTVRLLDYYFKNIKESLAKNFRLQEVEKTVLVFDSYSDMPQGKSYQQYLESTETKAELIDWFTQYIQQNIFILETKHTD